jgi:hypothetical protein
MGLVMVLMSFGGQVRDLASCFDVVSCAPLKKASRFMPALNNSTTNKEKSVGPG